MDTAGNVEGHHADGLGSRRALTNAAGSVTQTYKHDAFGVRGQSQGTSTQPFQYAGEQRDAETDLVFLRARYYDPATGRFLSRDSHAGTKGSPAGQHRYAYAQNNPATNKDPSGRFAVGACAGGSGAAGAYGTLGGCGVGTSGGDLGLLGYLGVGGSTGITAGAGGGILLSNANYLSDLSGPFGFVGVSAGLGGGGISADVSFGTNSAGEPIWEVQVMYNPERLSYTPEFSLPAELHSGVSDTAVAGFNVSDRWTPADSAGGVNATLANAGAFDLTADFVPNDMAATDGSTVPDGLVATDATDPTADPLPAAADPGAVDSATYDLGGYSSSYDGAFAY